MMTGQAIGYSDALHSRTMCRKDAFFRVFEYQTFCWVDLEPDGGQ